VSGFPDLWQPFCFINRSISDLRSFHMTAIEPTSMIKEYLSFLNDKAFPCVGAKAALARGQIKCMIAGHMACPKDDGAILQFLYDFVDSYRAANGLFHSAAILFTGPEQADEGLFDTLLWQRLQALAGLDARQHSFDPRVDSDPSSPDFSFSLKEEAFFIIGLHPASSRVSRRFKYPVLAFNPHAQFQLLREGDHYESMKAVVRKRDITYSGSVNPMLDDFGNSSEAAQYSGRQYDSNWLCPLKINHAQPNHNTSA
jgi:uncharacterized protein